MSTWLDSRAVCSDGHHLGAIRGQEENDKHISRERLGDSPELLGDQVIQGISWMWQWEGLLLTLESGLPVEGWVKRPADGSGFKV